jgi:hypothetical protein
MIKEQRNSKRIRIAMFYLEPLRVKPRAMGIGLVLVLILSGYMQKHILV